jgi:uncharacterized delta-60 repeat protein
MGARIILLVFIKRIGKMYFITKNYEICIGSLQSFIAPVIFVIGLVATTVTFSSVEGVLDESFGKGGKVVTQVSKLRDVSNDVAIQLDGKIVVAGFALSEEKNIYDFAITRYLLNGELDYSFGNNGIVLTRIGYLNSQAMSVMIQPDGKIIAVGTTNTKESGKNIAIVRYTKNGILDSSFGINGINSASIGVLDDYTYSAALQRDGRIVIAAHTNNGSNFDVALLQFTENGLLDMSFGTDGIVVTDIGSKNDELYDISIQDNGKIVAVGASQDENGFYNVLMVRYSSNGVLDSTFGVKGIVRTEFTIRTPDSVDRDDKAVAVAIQPDKKIVVAGYDYKDFIVFRYTSNGVLDETFSGDGKMNTSLSPAKDEVRDVVIQPDGKIILIGKGLGSLGKDKTLGSSSMDVAVARLNSDGSVDKKFGNFGHIMTVVGSGYDVGHGAAIQPDGKLIVTGYSKSNNYDFAMVRYDIGKWDTTPSFIASVDKAGIIMKGVNNGRVVAAGIDNDVSVPIIIKPISQKFNSINGLPLAPVFGHVWNKDNTINDSNSSIRAIVTAGGLHAPNNSMLVLGNTISEMHNFSISGSIFTEKSFFDYKSDKYKDLEYIKSQKTFLYLIIALFIWLSWLSIILYNLRKKNEK